ncbi:MAG: glutamyl-tRNA(Gln) amidotransferase subunit [Geminicoccaceae bacterium]|nr:glutamyl-tRNA(Gln) amidotransferase subunit [Geminicoccaceae bacterium]
MALSDELAWASATELALRIRRRELSPVEVVDAFIARIEARNPSLNAFVYFGFDDARAQARAAEQALMAGAALGPLHGVPCALKDLFDFKPGWKSTFGGVRALKDFVPDFYCAFAERIASAAPATTTCSARPATRSTSPGTAAAPRAAAPPRSPTASCRSPKAPTLTALAGYHPRDPYSLDERVDFTTAPRRSIQGWKIAYSPNFDVFPVDPRVAAVVAEAVRAFEHAGAHVEEVKVGIERPQREISDLWCRLIMPTNLHALEMFKAGGLDLLRDHRGDFPEEYLRWIEAGARMSALDACNDQAVRSEIYHAIQGVLNHHDLLITPTLACLPVENAADGNTMGPGAVDGEPVDRLIGWCLTYLINFSGHPAASIPAGMADGLPVGMQIIGRRYADSDVLAASAAFERLRPWQDSYQVCAERPL